MNNHCCLCQREMDRPGGVCDECIATLEHLDDFLTRRKMAIRMGTLKQHVRNMLANIKEARHNEP